MAKTNFAFEKRQRELEKKRKAEEKAQKKLASKNRPADEQDADEAGYETDETDTTSPDEPSPCHTWGVTRARLFGTASGETAYAASATPDCSAPAASSWWPRRSQRLARLPKLSR